MFEASPKRVCDIKRLILNLDFCHVTIENCFKTIRSRGKTSCQSFSSTIRIDELKEKGDLKFEVHRSHGAARNARVEPMTMKNGEVTFNVAPLELVTRRGAA